MNKLIITVFETEEKAFEGLTALKELSQNGDISLFATAVVNKDEKGEVTVKQVSEKGPIGTSVGMFSGALLGLIAGPVGMLVGAGAGMFGGMFYDLDSSKVNSNFVEEVSKALEEGKIAVIADVDEAWTAPVDTKMDALGAMVFRKLKSEVEDEQFDRETDALNAEIDELEEELKEASDNTKASIQKQIDKSKAKSRAIKHAAEKKLSEYKAEVKAKTEKLDAELKDASERRKKKIEKSKAKLNASYEATKAKLNSAIEKASKYLS